MLKLGDTRIALGVTVSGGNGREEIFRWTNVKQEMKMPGINTLEGGTR